METSPTRSRRALAVGTAILVAAGARASPALNALGTVGGVAIPGARTLGDGTVALGWSNAREPQLAHQGRHSNALLGIGLTPWLDLTGRFADYAPHDARDFVLGDGRDISANLKLRLPGASLAGTPLHLAVGVQDPTGGKVFFRSVYAVATWDVTNWTVTAGLGRSQATAESGRARALDGVFGGVTYRLPAHLTAGQIELAAEHDARQPLVALRWQTQPLTPGTGLRLHGAVHRSLASGAAPAATALTVGLSLEFGNQESRTQGQAAAQAPAASLASAPLPAEASAPARLGALQRELTAMGLERVRVGQLPDQSWVIAYQNRRFGHHELDTLGVVTGLAARAAPGEVSKLIVVAEKTAQPVLTLLTSPEAWRKFLEGGSAASAQEATLVSRASAIAPHAVDWLSDAPGPATLLQLQFVPQLNLNTGTEYGAYEYSLALQLLATAPLWQGAQIIASTQRRVARSDQADPWGAFPDLLQREGLQALLLHQSLWLGHHAYLGAGVGRLEYGALGVEGEALVFVPGRDDVIRLRGRQLELLPQMPLGADLQQWASYRWVASPSTWVEAGWQRYSDLGTGPLLTVSRWWRDFGVHLNYRSSKGRRYAGLELSFPITPRAAPASRWIHVSGPSQWRRGQRTRLTDSSNPKNWIEAGAAREYSPAWNLETQVFNSGRLGPDYLLQNLPRMREAFRLYAPPQPEPRPTAAVR